MRSVTEDKDQTYFLSAVRPEQLRKVYFPLGVRQTRGQGGGA